jgi:hypothetical protein
MKKLIIVSCVLSVVLWAGTSAWAQGKGKGGKNAGQKSAKEALPTTDTTRGQDKLAEARKKADEARKSIEQAKGKGAKDLKENKESAKKQAGKPADTLEKGKGKDHQQQLQAMQKQMQHELAKHMERQARLNRLHELAVQKGDTEMIARVDKLIAKEQELFERKGQRMQQRGQAAPAKQPSAEQQGKRGPKTSKEKPAEAGSAEAPQKTPPEAGRGAQGGAADTSTPAQGG